MAIFQRPRKSGRLRESHQRRGFKESFKEEQSESDNAAKKTDKNPEKNPSAIRTRVHKSKELEKGPTKPESVCKNPNHLSVIVIEDPQTSRSHQESQKNPEKSLKCQATDPKNSKRGPQISPPSFNHCNWSQTEDPQTWRTHQKSQKKILQMSSHESTNPKNSKKRPTKPESGYKNRNHLSAIAIEDPQTWRTH